MQGIKWKHDCLVTIDRLKDLLWAENPVFQNSVQLWVFFKNFYLIPKYKIKNHPCLFTYVYFFKILKTTLQFLDIIIGLNKIKKLTLFSRKFLNGLWKKRGCFKNYKDLLYDLHLSTHHTVNSSYYFLNSRLFLAIPISS